MLKPTPKQHQAWLKLADQTTKYPLFGGGANGGKSWLGCEWLLSLAYQHPGMKAFIGRTELKRLMQSTYITWGKVCKYHKVPSDDWHLDGKYNRIIFKNGSMIDLLDVKFLPVEDPLYERFGSLEYTVGWLEEAGEINFAAFDVLKTRVGRHMNDEFGLIGKVLLTCNPKKNWLYSKIYKPWKLGTLDKRYAFIQALYGDNTYRSAGAQDDLSGIENLATKERLMFGNWEYDDDPTALMTYDNITDLFTNSVVESEQKFLIVDVARYGQDKTVVTRFKGLHAYKIEYRTKQSIENTRAWIKEIAEEDNIPFSHILIDEDGVGGGLVDGLNGVKGYMANRTPFPNLQTKKPDNFVNLKAQCAYKLADYVNQHKMAVRTEDEVVKEWLIEELAQIKSKDADKDGKKAIIPKDKVKELLNRSPDFADTFVMRMYFEFEEPEDDTPEYTLEELMAIEGNTILNPDINL